MLPDDVFLNVLWFLFGEKLLLSCSTCPKVLRMRTVCKGINRSILSNVRAICWCPGLHLANLHRLFAHIVNVRWGTCVSRWHVHVNQQDCSRYQLQDVPRLSWATSFDLNIRQNIQCCQHATRQAAQFTGGLIFVPGFSMDIVNLRNAIHSNLPVRTAWLECCACVGPLRIASQHLQKLYVRLNNLSFLPLHTPFLQHMVIWVSSSTDMVVDLRKAPRLEHLYLEALDRTSNENGCSVKLQGHLPCVTTLCSRRLGHFPIDCGTLNTVHVFSGFSIAIQPLAGMQQLRQLCCTLLDDHQKVLSSLVFPSTLTRCTLYLPNGLRKLCFRSVFEHCCHLQSVHLHIEEDSNVLHWMLNPRHGYLALRSEQYCFSPVLHEFVLSTFVTREMTRIFARCTRTPVATFAQLYGLHLPLLKTYFAIQARQQL